MNNFSDLRKISAKLLIEILHDNHKGQNMFMKNVETAFTASEGLVAINELPRLVTSMLADPMAL